MDSTFVQKIADLERKAVTPREIETCDPRVERFVVDGEVKEFDVPNPMRSHRVDTVESMLLAATKWGQEGTLWHDDAFIRLLCDDERRDDNVRMPLRHSKQFKRLVDIGERQMKFDHKSLVRLLRTLFKDAIQEQHLLAVSNMRIDGNLSMKSDIHKGREAGLREFHKEVVTESGVEWPEVIPLYVPVYCNADLIGESAYITIMLDVDMDEGRINVSVVPGEIESAIDEVQSVIHKRLQESGLPVFAGHVE